MTTDHDKEHTMTCRCGADRDIYADDNDHAIDCPSHPDQKEHTMPTKKPAHQLVPGDVVMVGSEWVTVEAVAEAFIDGRDAVAFDYHDADGIVRGYDVARNTGLIVPTPDSGPRFVNKAKERAADGEMVVRIDATDRGVRAVFGPWDAAKGTFQFGMTAEASYNSDFDEVADVQFPSIGSHSPQVARVRIKSYSEATRIAEVINECLSDGWKTDEIVATVILAGVTFGPYVLSDQRS